MLRKLYVQVLLAVAFGALLGAAAPAFAVRLQALSDVFVRLIQMILAPVIFCTIVLGIARMENMKELGRVGAKALAYFEATSIFALLVGLGVVDLVRPGAGMHVDPTSLDRGAIAQYASGAVRRDGFVDFLVHTIPKSVTDSFAHGDIVQIVFFGVLLGVALSQAGAAGKPVVVFLESFLDAVFRIVRMVMRVAPVGALGAMAFTIGRYGVGSLASLGQVVLCVYLTAILFVAAAFGIVARLCGFSLWRFLLYIGDEVVTVAGTSSSESVLPQLMRKMEAAGVPQSIVGLVLPSGLTFNAVGSAIYLTVGALFIAQATDTPLSWGDQAAILAILMLTSIGSAGVTGAGFVTLAATLTATGKIPVTGVVLLLGVDRFMSEARSVTNTIGNAIGTVIVAAWEGSLEREKLERALSGPSASKQFGQTYVVGATVDSALGAEPIDGAVIRRVRASK